MKLSLLLLILPTFSALAADPVKPTYQCVVEQRPACGGISFTLPDDLGQVKKASACPNFRLVANPIPGSDRILILFYEVNAREEMVAGGQVELANSRDVFSVENRSGRLLCASPAL